MIKMGNKAENGQTYDLYTSSNGYVVYRWDTGLLVLTTKHQYVGNHFYMEDGVRPVFWMETYVNDYTIELCKRAYRKFLEADKNEALYGAI